MSRSVLLFELGGRRMAARVEPLRRVEARPGPDQPWLIKDSLGAPSLQGRGLVFQTPAGERTLAVDRVLGLRALEAGALHPLPPLVEALSEEAGLCGLIEADGELLPLLDGARLFGELPTTNDEPLLEGEA